MNELSPKELIHQIRTNKYKLGPDGNPLSGNEELLSDYNSALEEVSKNIYSDDSHFFYELIQNAQDNNYKLGKEPCLKFYLLKDDPTNSEGSQGCLCVINNELGFVGEDIKSICSTGKSTKKSKKNEGYIGEKGIGFKSVFKVSSSPHIFSNGFQIKLNGKDEKTGLSYVIPYWVDEIPDVVKANINSTCILLPLQEDKYADIKTALESYTPEVILFLDKLMHVEVHIPSENYKAIFEKKIHDNILTISSKLNDDESLIERFYLYEKYIQVPQNLKEERRQGVTERKISIAYPMQKYSSTNVFAYLPSEMISGLPFIINADFLMVSNRESITKSTWNTWLIEELGELASANIFTLLTMERVGSSALQYLPLKESVEKANKLFLPIFNHVISSLKSKECLKTIHGQFRMPSAVITVDAVRRRIFQTFSTQDEAKGWLDVAYQGFPEQLKALDIKPVEKAQLLTYINNLVQFGSISDDWFFQFYEFIFSDNSGFKQDELLALQILPSEAGQLFSSTDLRIFKPGPDFNPSEFSALRFFPEVYAFRASLYTKIEQKPDLFRKFEMYMGLDDFSFQTYFENVVFPSLPESIEGAELPELISLVSFIVQHWLKFEDIDFYSSGVPLLLSNGDLIFSDDDFGYKKLVQPKKFEGGAVWQKIFSDQEAEKYFLILHECYCKLDKEAFSEFLNSAGINHYPGLPVIELNASSSLGGRYRDYDNFINQAFFNSSNYLSPNKSGEVTLVPEIFWNLNKLDASHRSNLIRYLNYCFSEKDIGDSHFHYHKGGVRYLERFISPIAFVLKNEPWIKTTKGFRKSSECFLDNKNIRLIMSDSVPYVQDKLDEEFLTYLGVSNEATTEKIIVYLDSLRARNSSDMNEIAKIYRILSDRRADVSEEFLRKQLVFVPGINKWLLSSDVVWEDASSLDDESIVSLEKHYTELREFFVKNAGVEASVSVEHYSRSWLKLQQVRELNDSQLASLSKAFAKIRSAINHDSRQKWLKDFREKAKVYTKRFGWVDPDAESPPFLPDEERFRHCFEDKVPYVLRLDDLSYLSMSVLTDFLNIEKLSECVEVYLKSKFRKSDVRANKYLTSHTCKMLCYAIENRGATGSEIFNDVRKKGRIASLYSLQEVHINNLQLSARIKSTDIKGDLPHIPVFCDFDRGFIYIDNQADHEDILDLLSEEVSRFLLSALEISFVRPKDYEDTFRRYLCIESEESFKKHRDKKGWSLQKDSLAYVTKLEKTPKDKEIPAEFLIPEPATVSNPATFVNSPRSTPAPDSQYAATDNNTDDDSLVSARQSHHIGTHTPKTNDPGDSHQSKSSGHDREDASNSTGGSGGSQASYRGSVSRSKGIAASVNQARRNRLSSYVSHIKEEHHLGDSSGNQLSSHEARELGDIAELFVLNDWLSKGYHAKRMPMNNPGYDIEATDPNSGELFFIEVKADSYSWGDKGVGMSSVQFNKAMQCRKNYILAVVENVKPGNMEVSYIGDPAGSVTDYRFDKVWRSVAIRIENVAKQMSATSILENLLSLTDSENCKSIIQYCSERDYPLPDVGLDLVDFKGKVVFENVELVWEQERIAVFIDEIPQTLKSDSSWQAFEDTNVDSIKLAIDNAFSSRLTNGALS